ncbi:hypothetical protein BC940DRAFT_246905 [Gongronella butleri]|nr:hypothetical protein BC940DRAFT_246905 [Gongronella butleri]
MLWPQSPVYRVVKSDAPDDQQRRQLILQPISTRDDAHSDDNDDVHVSNANLLDVFAIVDAPSAYYLLSSYHGTTLQDLIKYNPGILHSNLKKGFIIYQLLRILASLHHRGIVHGSLKTSDIFVNENMWIQVAGLQYSIGTMSMPKTIQQEPLVMQWVRGEISNYSYLMILNALAGRREGDPNFHPILPWVTDFSGDTIEDGWRDFTKTKFRMNKGDEQLDFTFDGPMPHHITDILSDITYYVYLARRTPIAASVLCQFVRSKYEPNEYPSSMERLYHWTPDECIPEFYTDPSIFKSIHDDMPDLQLPRWAASPEDFVAQHAKALESEFVSSHLHHWIDLTFGKHLTGKEGIESKNVALPLLAGQNTFMKHGIVQLFQANHPQRGCNWNKSRSEQSSSTTPQRTLRANNNLSPLPAIAKSIVDSPPSMTVGTTRDHAISVHSTASSSLDTSSLSTHTKNMSMDASSSIANANANATPAIGTSHHAASLSSSLRSDPIRLPTDMPDDYFTENLNHYEQTMNFAASYRGDMEGAGATDADALPTHAFLPPNTARYNIDPDSHTPLPTNKFSMETAHDMHSLGISPDVQGVIDALQSPQWYERPTAKSILLASFSSTTLQHPRFSLPLDSCIPDMYEFQAAFYQAEWSRRLYLADKWIDRICDMDGEPIIAMFETLRPQIPKVLFDAKVIKDFVHGLGIPLFLQQLLPCYIEALAIDDASIQRDGTAGGTLEGTVGALSPKPMATLAANSLLHICQLLGPILTSKHIIRQLVKLLFRDDSARPVLMRVVVSVIGNLFGDTFTAVQHTYLISLLELPSASRPLTERQGRVNEVLLTLLSELLPLMSAPTILNELRSGFMATLYKLLDPAHAIDAPTAAMTPLQLTLSMNTIQYLLRLADRIPLVDWEALVMRKTSENSQMSYIFFMCR